ncbi:MAG: response regulator [Thermodesulfobacteriota bacterium]|nr:response regulator [Thermodesulfobacteriota bacterium]
MAGNILIVDQEQEKREFLKTLLEKRSCKVTVLEDAYSINNILREKTFDIIFLDILTVGIRDIHLLANINRKYPGSYIILITSRHGNGFVKAAMDVGIYGCINKPFNIDEVLTMVKYLIPDKKLE